MGRRKAPPATPILLGLLLWQPARFYDAASRLLYSGDTNGIIPYYIITLLSAFSIGCPRNDDKTARIDIASL